VAEPTTPRDDQTTTTTTPPAAPAAKRAPREKQRAERRYARQRLLDPNEGPQIVGFVAQLGRTATVPDIVGALTGVEGDSFTRDEVHRHMETFLTRKVG